jgi:hypothetical protein
MTDNGTGKTGRVNFTFFVKFIRRLFMRRMAFSHTAPQILDRSKTVTRRTGWRSLKPGDLIQAVEKARGLRKGERVRSLAVLRVVNVRVERLSRLVTDARYAEDELPREGFPCWSRDEFVAMFLRVNRLASTAVAVTRIEFEYVQPDRRVRR